MRHVRRGGSHRARYDRSGTSLMSAAVPLPLAEAAKRLRGRPGRPRTSATGADTRHTASTPDSLDGAIREASGGTSGSSSPRIPLIPRLLDLQATANYLTM